VALGTGAPREVLVVPESAIQDVGGRAVVFVGDAASGFRAQPVSVGPAQDGLVEIRQGLTGAERVVTTGAFLVKSELQKSTLAGD
jgi:cobalt-zinc-cadmium efflux system membrane fusion protein